MPERDQEEQDLRIDQMALNIEKMRFDMEAEQLRREALQRWETKKFVVSALLVVVAAFAAGATWWNYLHLTH